MSALLIAASLWASAELARLTRPQPAPPTVGVPRGETPRNVRPWTPPTTPATVPGECVPPKEKR